MPGTRVVVIGAGVGGLVAGLHLATRGLDVTVCERAPTAGGKMRQTAIGAHRIDAGPTVFTMREVFDAIFADAGAIFDDQVTLRRADVLARHAWDADTRLDLFADKARSRDAIAGFAGADEGRRYDAYCEAAARLYRTLDRRFMRRSRPSLSALVATAGVSGLLDLWTANPFATLWDKLGSYFHDPRLRQLFGRYATYCGSSPFLAPATLMLISHVEQEGVWLIDGGMFRLTEALVRLATARGATMRCGAPVREIVVEAGRTRGVVLESGERITADAVVCNADVAALTSGLFGAPGCAAVSPTPNAARSLSAVTWAAVARTDGFALSRHNVFFSADYAAEFDDLTARRLPRDPTVYVCAQDRGDDGTMAPGPERLLCLVNAPASGDGILSQADIEQCETTMSRTLARCGLTIEGGVTPSIRTTPADFHAAFPATGRGSVRPGIARMAGLVPASGRAQQDPGAIPGRGQRTSGTGGTDGGPVGADGGGNAAGRLRFDAPVTTDGYAWWYVDALSDDGRDGLTIIAFIGSVFSPYYARARRAGHGDPSHHCALNVALYGKTARRWAMTERGRTALHRSASTIAIGPSSVEFDGTALTFHLDERSMPWLSPLRGTVRVTPTGLTNRTFDLDAAGLHRWSPLAPMARVDVAIEAPALRWSGRGYLDTNDGDVPLESSFRTWHWARATTQDRATILYDVVPVEGAERPLALQIGADGTVTETESPPRAPLPKSRWRIARGDPCGRGNNGPGFGDA